MGKITFVCVLLVSHRAHMQHSIESVSESWLFSLDSIVWHSFDALMFTCVSVFPQFSIRYDSASRVVRITRMLSGGAGVGAGDTNSSPVEKEETFVLSAEFPTLFDWLQAELDVRSLSPKTRGSLWKKHVRSGAGDVGHAAESSDYPFPFAGGFVGFFAYEMRRECGSASNVDSVQSDASFVYSERFVAIDHARGRIYAVALCDLDDDGATGGDDMRVCADEATAWIRATLLRASCALAEGTPPPVVTDAALAPTAGVELPEIRLRHDYNSYTHNINECLREIYGGESYELCLTNQITAPLPVGEVRPATVYNAMRKLNPAPYGALLRFGDFWVLQVRRQPACLLCFVLFCSSLFMNGENV